MTGIDLWNTLSLKKRFLHAYTVYDDRILRFARKIAGKEDGYDGAIILLIEIDTPNGRELAEQLAPQNHWDEDRQDLDVPFLVCVLARSLVSEIVAQLNADLVTPFDDSEGQGIVLVALISGRIEMKYLDPSKAD